MNGELLFFYYSVISLHLKECEIQNTSLIAVVLNISKYGVHCFIKERKGKVAMTPE